MYILKGVLLTTIHEFHVLSHFCTARHYPPMVDVNTFMRSIKINWIKALMLKDEANWKIIPSYLLDHMVKLFLY